MTSTTRATGGAGFDFEDQVAAWLLLDLLHGNPLCESTHRGTRLQMQVQALGWAIDDILVTTGNAPEDQQFLALSCKGNKQVTAAKLPAEFVTSCWQQWFKQGTNPFRKAKDGLVLVTRGRNVDFMATWSEVKNYALDSDPNLALARIRETGKFQTLFLSAKAPANSAGLRVEDQDVLALIRAIHVLPLELQTADSQTVQIAIERARALLTAGSYEAGRALWLELIDLARRARLGSGTLDLPALIAHLRGRFSLKDHPAYSKSWATLRTFTAETRSQIETTLGPGQAVARSNDEKALRDQIGGAAISVVFGNSGCGKSALLKTVLDLYFSDAEQVWLDPSSSDTLLNQAKCVAAGLDQPLTSTLRHSAARVVLVLDAAERWPPDSARKAKELLRHLAPDSDETDIRIVIVGQTDAWVDGRLLELAGTAASSAYEVKDLSVEAVGRTLRASGLSALALDDAAVRALTNLRTLSWVVQAALLFQSTPGANGLSLPAIADRLWIHWSNAKPSIQRLLMRLAEREASFEHSFAISQLDASDIAALDDLPTNCPLKRDPATGRIRFAHDLASEWARYRRLRELSESVVQWQEFAGNPFWYGPIRMLGQHLLRVRVEGRVAWEVAFETAEMNRATAPLADDLLLDALFIDPEADALLESQAGLLFADEGRRLLRLVRRFEHIASEPRARPAPGAKFSELSLYMETEFRRPVYGRWPPMARFLSRHCDQVAALMSTEISRLCERWLAGTPNAFANGQPAPYRLEFAKLALACAREVQATLETRRIIGLHEDAKLIFRAALASAHDLPKEVGDWALEMSRRRPAHADVLLRVAAARQQEASAHASRMESDADYRRRREYLRSLPSHLASSRKLPAWPLGPQSRVERSFREASLEAGALSALMHASPEVASEVLLACLIEDEPVEEYRSHIDLDRELGIEYSDDSYPTAPWKSPFLLFLRINATAALSTLIKLVDFATDRWARAAHTANRSAPSALLILNLEESGPRHYSGHSRVFNWSHESSNFIGPLHSALAALEHWLCETGERHTNQPALVEQALRDSHSSAIVGVLSNFAKVAPELLRGPLRPLAGSLYVHLWDSKRVEYDGIAPELGMWARQGETVFELAKQWLSRPYRRVEFTDVVIRLLTIDSAFGASLLAETAKWVVPESADTKAAVEISLLRARLDHRNYQLQQTSPGEPTRRFVCPPDVLAAVRAFQSEGESVVEVLSLAEKCRSRLSNPKPLSASEADYLDVTLRSIDAYTKLDIEEELKNQARVAAACTLKMRGGAWLEDHPEAADWIEKRINDEIDAAWVAPPDDGPRATGALSPLSFVARTAIERWLDQPSRESDAMVLRVMLAGEENAVAAVFFAAVGDRDKLGPRWWRLLQIALIWSALLMLKPRYGDDVAYSKRWQRWRRWLAARDLSVGTGIETIKLIHIAQAAGRIDFLRMRRRLLADNKDAPERPAVPWHGGLHGGVLQSAFAWLFMDSELTSSVPIPVSEQRTLLVALWEHQAWWLRGSTTDRGEFQVSGQFAYEIAARLARIASQVSIDACASVWRPVLELGPNGHNLINHFLGSWFLTLSENTSAVDFAPRWRGIMEYVVKDLAWTEAAPYYHRQTLSRCALGFHHPAFLVRIPGHAGLIDSLTDVYQAWAAVELTGPEENLSEFCSFLAHQAGKPLRLLGLAWMVAAKTAKSELGHWYRDHTSSNFMGFLNVVVGEHAAEIRSNQSLKAALLDLATLAAAKQLKASLQLLDRIRRL